MAVDGAKLDLPRVRRYKDRMVQANAKGVELLLKKNGVSLLHGRGRLAGPGRVEVAPTEGEPFMLETTHTVLDTGSVIRGLPGNRICPVGGIGPNDAPPMKPPTLPTPRPRAMRSCSLSLFSPK